jgi:hypothetical protein
MALLLSWIAYGAPRRSSSTCRHGDAEPIATASLHELEIRCTRSRKEAVFLALRPGRTTAEALPLRLSQAATTSEAGRLQELPMTRPTACHSSGGGPGAGVIAYPFDARRAGWRTG